LTVLEGRYELGQRIGGGGMAEVVEAHDRKLDRRVAVKLMRDGSADPRARERFVREAQHAARFSHPNVVGVYDVGDSDGQPFLVMELVEGKSLAQILAARKPLPADESLAITDSLLAALDAAHSQGLVHRDVKPANVLVTDDGRVKLADFGIAKAAEAMTSGLTATGQVMGTPIYLSPEQVEGHDATAQTDLYATGVVLYEMLTGEPPFTAEHPLAVALAHRDTPAPRLDQVRPDLPVGLAGVVARALEKDPIRRFASAREMRDALKTVGDGAPAGVAPMAAMATTQATPLPAATSTLPVARRSDRPRTRKKRGLSGSSALLFVLAAVLGAGAGWLLIGGGADPSTRAEGVKKDVTPASVTPPSVSTTTTITLPTTIDGLIAALALSPSAAGEKGDELLRGLMEIRDRPDPKGKRAEHLVDEIQHWVEDGQLEPHWGALALKILGYSNAPNFDQAGGAED
jgi:serine/threonine-protein kinase